MTDRNYRMHFGQHKGETLEEIYVDDRAYLEWCIDNLEEDSLREKIEETYKELKDRLRVG